MGREPFGTPISPYRLTSKHVEISQSVKSAFAIYRWPIALNSPMQHETAVNSPDSTLHKVLNHHDCFD
jgi:hypothetical protein